MLKSTVNLLRCIKCGSTDLVIEGNSNEIESGYIFCRNCKRKYQVRNGIPVFLDTPKVLNDERIKIFHKHAERYDSWFFSDKGSVLFQNELDAINELLRGIELNEALEIGVGTGEFASKLGVRFGVDPAFNALLKARERGIECVQGIAEKLPFRDNSFNVVFLIVTICYVSDIDKTFEEAYRVLRGGGYIVIGFINKDSSWGRTYLEKKRRGHLFYGPARFYSYSEIKKVLERNNFSVIRVVSTLYQKPYESPRGEKPVTGFNKEAGFIVILARKNE